MEMGPGVIEEVQRVVEAVNAVRAIEEPERRARAITELLRAQTEADPDLRDERRQIALSWRAEEPPVSFREIARRLGVSLGTAQDILRGHSGPWNNRPRAKKKKDEGNSGADNS
jgi:hypothetical protein